MGASPKMTGGTASWDPNTYKSPYGATDWRKALNPSWQAYQPSKVQTGYTVNQGNVMQTPYTPMQGGVNKALSGMLQGGGYSPQAKQTMYAGAMAPVQEEAQKQREQAQADAYSRGLGGSGVLSRSYGNIDQSVLSRSAEVSGGIEAASAQNAAQNVLNAIGAYQSGQASQQDIQLSLEQMRQQNATTNAQLSQQYEQLKAQTNLDDRNMQLMLAQLEQAAYKTGADQELAWSQLRNLSAAQLEQGKWVAEQQAKSKNMEFWGSLISNIIGSGAILGGGTNLFGLLNK